MTAKKAIIFTTVLGLLFTGPACSPVPIRTALNSRPKPHGRRCWRCFSARRRERSRVISHKQHGRRCEKRGTTSGASMLSGFSMLTGQLNSRGQQLQTFEAGPTLVLL